MSIFDTKQIKNNASRSTFDMSQHNLFTARLGQLTPVMFRNLMPGDSVNLDLSSFTQTSPLQKNAFARIKEHFDVFFVPYRLLYDKANDIVMENKSMSTANTSFAQDNILPTSLPYTTFSSLKRSLKLLLDKEDFLGQSRFLGSRRLLHYLGYGDIGKFVTDSSNYSEDFYEMLNEKLSLMPLAAYQKIYSDFFRFQQWEDANPYSYNFNYLITNNSANSSFIDVDKLLGISHYKTSLSPSNSLYGDGLMDIRYVNYNKDFLFGILPSQIADVYVNPNVYSDQLFNLHFNPDSNAGQFAITLNQGVLGHKGTNPVNAVLPVKSIESDKLNSQYISVLSLRAAYALQKWSEVQQFSDNNYKALVKAHFGVDVPDYTAQLSEYLGGTSSMIQINDVVNTNLDGANPDRQAIANGVTDAHVNYTAKEHGILMVLYYASPLLDYDASLVYDPQLFPVNADDFPKAEFDNLGLEPIYNDVLYSAGTLKTIGYAPRYWSWKSCIDYYKGAFCSSLKNYVIQKDLSLFSFTVNPKLSYAWFKVNPSDVNSIFVVQSDDKLLDYDGDQFYVNSGQSCKITRSLSYSGMPY